MKIAVSSYSFQALIQAGAMTQLDCVQAAKRLGFDAVEFIGLQPHDSSAPAEYAERIREESERCGLPVSNYTIAADFLTGSGGDLQREIERAVRRGGYGGAAGQPQYAPRCFRRISRRTEELERV